MVDPQGMTYGIAFYVNLPVSGISSGGGSTTIGAGFLSGGGCGEGIWVPHLA